MTRRRHWLSALFGIAVILGSCGLPVRVGVEHLRPSGGEARAASVGQPTVFTSRPREGAVSAPSVVPVQAQAPATPSTPPSPPVDRLVRAPSLPQPTGPDDLRSVRLEADGGSMRPFVTFGQVFAPGAVPAGSSIVARGRAGPLPTQADIKTTHPDGSARMVVLTVRADGPGDLMLLRTRAPAADPPVALTGLAGRYDLRVALSVRAPVAADYSIDLGEVLAQALARGTASRWLTGPLVSEARIEAPVTGSLRLVADIRAYADGSVRTDLQFNNDIAMRPDGGALTYDAVVTLNGRPALREQELRHYQYQTWHKELWNAAGTEAHVVHDTPALARAGAVPNYDVSLGVDGGLIGRLGAAAMGKDVGPLGAAGLARYMPTTGGRGEIGITTVGNAAWLMTHHPDARRFALAQADAAGSVPWHFHDADAGMPVSPSRHPRLWVDYRGGRWGTVGLTQPVDQGSGWTPDTSHQPELSYVAYILTGSRYRYDQLEAQALFSILAQSPDYRRDDKGIVVHTTEQVRGRAWALRAVEQAAFIAPDDARLRGYFRSVVDHNIAHLQNEMRWRTVGEVYGVFGDGVPGNPAKGVSGPWQQDFLASVLGMAAVRGVAGAAELVAWMQNFTAGRFLSGDKGFRPAHGTAFYMAFYPEGGREPYMTWRELEAGNIARNFTKDNADLANNEKVTMRIVRGTLAIVATVTGQPQAMRALDWVHANLPGTTTAEFRRDPTWNIVPMRRSGG